MPGATKSDKAETDDEKPEPAPGGGARRPDPNNVFGDVFEEL